MDVHGNFWDFLIRTPSHHWSHNCPTTSMMFFFFKSLSIFFRLSFHNMELSPVLKHLFDIGCFVIFLENVFQRSWFQGSKKVKRPTIFRLVKYSYLGHVIRGEESQRNSLEAHPNEPRNKKESDAFHWILVVFNRDPYFMAYYIIPL